MLGIFIRNKKIFIVIGAAVVVALIIGFSLYGITHWGASKQEEVTLILSPHYGDAIFSMGGIMAQENHQTIVATVFNGSKINQNTDHININALNVLNAKANNFFYDSQDEISSTEAETRTEISQDIQALIASFAGKKIQVYGPAYFVGDDQEDEALLHKAYIDVVTSFIMLPETSSLKKDVTFYMYEDYPLTARFMSSSTASLLSVLQNDPDSTTADLTIKKVEIPLTTAEVDKKIKAESLYGTSTVSSREFTSTRCGANPPQACEVVYQIAR